MRARRGPGGWWRAGWWQPAGWWPAALVLTLAATPAGAGSERFAGRVVTVHDGDTITVERGESYVRLRLDGVDCPELAQDYGRRAREHTARLVSGRTVRVEADGEDRHGRLLARVLTPDGDDLGLALVEAGLAWHFTRYSDDRTLAAAEKKARAGGRGLWAEPDPVPPWEFRRAAAGGASADRPEAADPSTAGVFHGNTRSFVFHAPGCPHYDCRLCTRLLRSREEAGRLGYKPHRECVR